LIDPSKKQHVFKLDPAWTKDVGGHGVGLVTRAHCMVGSKLKLRFGIPGRPKPFEAEGTVVWSQLDDSSGSHEYRIGVAFDTVSKDDHQALMRFVEEQAERSVG
jgi:hypothetical protein